MVRFRLFPRSSNRNPLDNIPRDLSTTSIVHARRGGAGVPGEVLHVFELVFERNEDRCRLFAAKGMLITIRPVEPADVISMAAIRAREWETQAFWTGRIGSYLGGEHSPLQALSVRAAFVALDGNELVGFVAGHLTRRFGCDGELQWINVIKEKRGKGIADRLMAKMGAWFTEQDAHRVCVNVEPKNTAASRLYSRFGARPLNEHWMIWQDSRLMGTPVSE